MRRFRFRNCLRVLLIYLAMLQILLLPLPAFAYAGSMPPTPEVKDYLLADAATGDVLLANEPNRKVYPASTTKIMTALLLLESEPDLSKTVTVGSEINALSGSGASSIGLLKGEEISLKDLLYGLMLSSGADAAMTIAVDVGGSMQGFVDMMNVKAEQLGMTGTHFTNPHGLHDPNHYSTTADLKKLSIAAMDNETFRKIVSTYLYTIPATNRVKARTIHNTDKLISTASGDMKYRYQYAIGIKTGFTDEAGGCLVAAAEKDGQILIAVLLGDNSKSQVRRWRDAKDMFDYGFSQKRIDLYARISSMPLSTTLPNEAKESKLSPVIKDANIIRWLDSEVVDALSHNATTLDVCYSFNVASPSPTGRNTPVGTVTYSYRGLALYTCEVVKKEVNTPAPSTGQPGSIVRLVSIILLILGAMLAFSIISQKVISSRRKQKQRYGHSTRGSSKLRSPHHY